MANISEQEVNAAIRALQGKGMPDEQINEVLKAMSFGESSRQPKMSQTDGINMISRDRDVPGAYVDQYQKSMDAYGAHMMQQEAAAQRTEAMGMTNGTLPIDPFQGNPNVRIETEGQRTTVGPNGQIIIY